MTQEEMEAFLSRPLICRLGCLDGEGYPYVVPVWYHYADYGFYIVGRERSDWAHYLSQDGRTSLCIDSDSTPQRVLVRGKADTVEKPNVGGRWVAIAEQMAHRYMGEEQGREYVQRTLDEPRWLFFVHPTRLTSWQGGWARRYKHYDW